MNQCPNQIVSKYNVKHGDSMWPGPKCGPGSLSSVYNIWLLTTINWNAYIISLHGL